MKDILENIEYEIALLVRLTTAISPKLGELDRSGYILLSKLEESEPMAINAIADELRLNVSTASRQIAALEAKQFIRRSPDQRNGRTSLIEITPRGREVFGNVRKARIGAYSEILGGWPEAELSRLEETLEKLNHSLADWEKK
ncbi:MarR family winged helix-turn-helix transcriptional regulator [Paenibacillus chitinolyticus]|uniref:MarR family winged helix-turn-helix transcriptional regulator n=1 Tax=Paenibacillus chitinolyticus TaxID=79263 RepID=UPI003D0915E4